VLNLYISSKRQARVSTSAAEFDHQPKSVAVGPTANAPATGSNTQSPAHDGAVNGGVSVHPVKEPIVSHPESLSPTIHSESSALVPAEDAQSLFGPQTVHFLVNV
jgi:hypothetical protein